MAAVLLYVCSTFVVWMCCLTTHPLAKSLPCPSSCNCLQNHAKCSQTGLVDIPKDIPSWVMDVDFQDNGIKHIRPGDFRGLDKIEHLNINQNQLKEVNGSVFGDLTSLRTLKLDNNKLQEMPVFPENFGIKELYLSNNEIVSISSLALERMPNLKLLDLSGNNILSIVNGTFPKGCGITTLNLNANEIAVLGKGSLSNLTELQTLKMNKNKLRELHTKGFMALTQLRTLELMKNDISVIKGLTFKGLTSLHTLKLKRNDISTLETAAFFTLENLTNLQLGHNKIRAIKADWMFGLRSLRTLSLPRNRISEIDPKSWMCRYLEKLDLSYNQLKVIKTLSLKHLKLLFLNHNSISVTDGAFSELRRLHTLELNHNDISWGTGDVAGMFHSLSRLNRLGLRSNGISFIPVDAFSGLQQLKELDLGGNNITSIQENAFETLRKLESLTFNSSLLSCDCHLAWLPDWLEKNGFRVTATGLCVHPPVRRGRSLYEMKDNQVRDTEDRECDEKEFLRPNILESPMSTVGSKGDNISLTCVARVTGNSPTKISWKRDQEMLPESLFQVRAVRDGDVTRYTSTLTLRNLHHSAAEAYQCIVMNEFGKATSQKAYINVHVFPVFTVKPKNITVKAGKNAQLECAAEGQPVPIISWQKDGGVSFPAARERRMKVIPDDHHFFITKVKASDQGVYSCKAKNDAGTITSNVTVTVLETPDFVKPMQRRVSTRLGEESVLQCRASGSPRPKLSWLKGGKIVVETSRHFFSKDNEILVIVDTKFEDAGIYSCRISNSLGTVKGTTQLQVLTASGEAVKASSSSFGLDDKSTTTGIIIIAVVCCVVGTSLVWVIIIYQTRKRHEMYSAAPSDETTLPGEVPSSGYMSSDREGSYSQGQLMMTGYHYQDYQMKESGYESSSGQFRVRPVIYPNGIDEDEPMHRVTAGDRLLKQTTNANSAASLQYVGSEDGDTLGSRHSTSSGQHSGTSEQPSSHSYHSGHSSSPVGHTHPHQQLHVRTDSHVHESLNSPWPSVQHSPNPESYVGQSEEYLSNYNNGVRGSLSGSRSFIVNSSPERKPLLQTFHPKKHTSSHERFHADTLDGVGPKGEREERRGVAPPRRRAVSRDAVAVTEGVGDDEEAFINEQGFRPRTHSDSCDKRAGGYNHYDPVYLGSGEPQGERCAGCAYRLRVGGHSSGKCIVDEKSSVLLPHEIQKGEDCVHYSHSNNNSGSSSCPKHGCNGDGGGYTNYKNSEGRHLPSAPPLSSPSSAPASRHHYYHQQHCLHSGRPQHAKGYVHSKSNGNKTGRKSHNTSGSVIYKSEVECSGVSNGRSLSPPCCCEVMRDPKYCTTCSPVQWRGEEETEGGRVKDEKACVHCCHHDKRGYSHTQHPPTRSVQHNGKRGGPATKTPPGNGRSASQGNVGHDPGYSDCDGCSCEHNQHQSTNYSSKSHHPVSGSGSRPSGLPPSYSSLSCTPPPYPPPTDRPVATSAVAAGAAARVTNGASSSTIPTSSSPSGGSNDKKNSSVRIKGCHPNKNSSVASDRVVAL